jgi:hypothetical protein
MNVQEPTRIERRCGQRFELSIPVLLRVCGEDRSGTGFTQDLSSRGALIWTDLTLNAGQMVEITLVMPAAITLGDDMNVRCQARVVRVHGTGGRGEAIAVQIEKYDFPAQGRPAYENVHAQPARH